jgi:hypothetical protein
MGKKGLAIVTPSLTVKCQNDRVSRNQRLIQQKVESAHVCLSNAIQAGRCSGQGPECLKAGLGRTYNSKFPVTRTVSSGFQLAALELRKQHGLSIFTAKE